MSKKDHPICDKGPYWETMHRLYCRDKGKFLPIGWICHYCKHIILDYEIKEYVEKNKETFKDNTDYKWYKRIKIKDIFIINPLAYLE